MKIETKFDIGDEVFILCINDEYGAGVELRKFEVESIIIDQNVTTNELVTIYSLQAPEARAYERRIAEDMFVTEEEYMASVTNLWAKRR